MKRQHLSLLRRDLDNHDCFFKSSLQCCCCCLIDRVAPGEKKTSTPKHAYWNGAFTR